MGKLHALELFNFKSYKGHHILQFGDSYFTSIIGPNGSGKSNSMDAISFVLGIKSSHLRSAHLKDLVYRGRVLKHSKIQADGTATDEANGTNGDANGDANGGADYDEDGDVDTQSTQRNDPQTAWVQAVYEDDAGDVQRWKRSITSSGSSEYRINNRIVTAKQYNEALEAENILIKARNFLVFQGDVESIANQNPRDLTRLIEQISGSLEFKSEYETLRAEKDRADEDQQHKLNQRRGINGEIKQYREQKMELDRFEQLRTEKDEAVVTHVLWKLFHFQRAIENGTAEMQRHQEELKEFRRNVKKYEDDLADAQKEHAKAGRDVSKYEREIKKREKSVEEKENALVPVDEKLSISANQLERTEQRSKELAAERDEQQQQVKHLEKSLATVEKARERWQQERRAQQQQAGRALSDNDLQEYQRLRGEVYKRSGNDQIKVDNVTRQLKTDEEMVKSLKAKVDSMQAQVTGFRDELTGLKKHRSEVAKTVKTTTKEVDEKKKAINALASERERTLQKHRELDEKLLEVLRKLQDATAQQRETRREAQSREIVGQLKRTFPGVRGMVHQLCTPKQKKYETAVITALGRDWETIVVDTEKAAKDCLQYLRDQKLQERKFIPQDTIIFRQPNSSLRGMEPGMRLAIDTLEFDTSVERAMGYVCGDAIVTDTLRIAQKICYDRKLEVRAVVLDGTVLHKGGNMTGGSEPSESKRKFEDSDVEKLRTMVNKFQAEIAALPRGHKREAEEEALQGELSVLEGKLKAAQDELATLDRNVASKTKELEYVESQLAEAQPKYDEQARGVETLRQSLEEQSSAIAEIEDDVFAAFCQRLGYSDIREYESQQGSLEEEAAVKKAEFERQIARLTNQLSFATQRVEQTKKRIKQIETAAQSERARIAQLEAEKEAIGGEIDELNAEIEELNEQVSGLREKYDERAEKVNEARREVQKRSKSVEKTLRDVAALDAEVQQAASGRYGVLRNCKVENIELPLERGSRKLDSLPLEDAILEEEEQEDVDAMDIDGDDSAAAPKVKDYGIHVSFEDLDEELQDDSTEQCEASLSETINNLASELEKMAPNMRSADRLEATSERLKATDREFKDSASAARSATTAFEKIKKQRMELFNKAFDHISEQISQVYRELTKTASFPLGGTASLDVEDDAEPYLSGVKYHAMPPLKRFRDMEHLSGGEKTMAALALLFAVHTYAPSPFFVLDEVDAALDNANTAQLAQYVREHAGPGMQFVVISLKTGLFQNSETLVGVMRDQSVNSSRALTLDLRKYQAV